MDLSLLAIIGALGSAMFGAGLWAFRKWAAAEARADAAENKILAMEIQIAHLKQESSIFQRPRGDKPAVIDSL